MSDNRRHTDSVYINDTIIAIFGIKFLSRSSLIDFPTRDKAAARRLESNVRLVVMLVLCRHSAF